MNAHSDYAGPDRRDPVYRHELDAVVVSVKSIDTKLQLHTEQEIRMDGRIANIEGKLEKIDSVLSSMTDAWIQSKGALKFIAMAVAFCAAGWQVVLWVKDHVVIKGG